MKAFITLLLRYNKNIPLKNTKNKLRRRTYVCLPGTIHYNNNNMRGTRDTPEQFGVWCVVCDHKRKKLYSLATDS